MGGSAAFIYSYSSLIYSLFTLKISTRKNFGLTNTHEKDFWTYKISTRKNLEPTKYPREKILDSRNIREKKFPSYEIPTRKNFRLTKYPRDKNFNPRRYDGMRPTRLTMEFSTPVCK